VAEGDKMIDKNRRANLTYALSEICCSMFEEETLPVAFPVEYWINNYPLEVILYALLETQQKVRRNKATMCGKHIENFAVTIMERRDREQIKRARREQGGIPRII
jgi:hypothetical protein